MQSLKEIQQYSSSTFILFCQMSWTNENKSKQLSNINNAFAGGEQNASGEKIVTAPTCGSSGIVPTVLYYQQQKNDFSDDCIVRALMTAGVVGSLIKTKLKIYCLMQKNMISICFFLSSGAII